MNHLLLRWAINSGALMLLPHLMRSIRVEGLYTALVAALALGLINALLRPLLILITLPINILSLGLFTLVINALLFWFAASFVKGFLVAGFLGRHLGVEAGFLVFRVVQLGEAIGDLAADHEQLEAVGELRVDVVASRQR